MTAPDAHADRIVDLYERHADAYARDRGAALHFERRWLDRFTSTLPPQATILDVGCGSGQPIAGYLISRDFRIVGVDAAATMIRRCRASFPQHEWIQADMRTLNLGRAFDAVLAWDSFFHLTQVHQRQMFAIFAKHSRLGAPLMFTSGPVAGVAIGSYQGEPLYHDSLDPTEYRSLLTSHGYDVIDFRAQDPDCGHHTIWLARYNERSETPA